MNLLECSGPIDKQAARVIRKARPEDVWIPKIKETEHQRHSQNVLPTAPIPRAASQMKEVLGKRRDRLTVVGYAKEQNSRKPAKWVVRCDCGNFEHRSSILRWLGTDARDMCLECRKRTFLTHGEWSSREKPDRNQFSLSK